MNTTPNLSTHTFIGLTAMAVGITTFIAAFLLYRVYRHKIRQYICHLFLVTSHQPAPQPPTVPLHYVPRAHGGPIGPALPALFPSQSSGLSSPSYPSDSSCIHMEQEELDLREKERRVLYADYQSLPLSLGSPSRLEESLRETARSLESTRSSPEFPTRHPTPRPVIITTDSEAVTTTSPPISQIDSHTPPHASRGPQTDPPHRARPLSPYAQIPKPSPSNSPPTYEELQQQLKTLLSEKAQPRPSIEESLPTTKSLPPTNAAQIVQEWRTKCPPSTGGDNEPPAPKPTPSTKLSKKSGVPSLYASSQGGSKSIGSTAPASSLGDMLGSLLTPGWYDDNTRDKARMTLEERASEYTSIWNTHHTNLVTEVSWRLSEAGQAWEQADLMEQEDIINHSATEQAIKIFNEFYPRYALPVAAPYQSRYQQTTLLKTPPMPTSQPMPFSTPRSHPYKGKGQVQAGGDHNLWEAPVDSDDESESGIEVDEPQPGGTGQPPVPQWQPHTGFFKGAKPPDRYADPSANPIDAMKEDAPWIGCKPNLIRKPLPFKGEPDDIDWFITDCQMYFQVHSTYMWLDLY
ncbi:uncharacterized protein ARMOST_04632 [Armillaria ostoyae]|uniref:Uncharacterized protein n=1 Tax=Armillaria ostoyae TaxID=47428 RepID=A0A284QY42_ARMOS|nr:uncharacterized protein ARMOST_04632 [Armillaria ostoyae]